MDACTQEIERMMKRLFDPLERGLIDGAMRPSRPANWGMVGPSTSPKSSSCDPKAHPPGKGGTGRGRMSWTPVASKKKGGAQKRRTRSVPTLEENFSKVLQDHTAGDPMRADVKWTNLSRPTIVVSGHRVGDSDQSTRRVPVAPQTRLP